MPSMHGGSGVYTFTLSDKQRETPALQGVITADVLHESCPSLNVCMNNGFLNSEGFEIFIIIIFLLRAGEQVLKSLECQVCVSKHILCPCPFWSRECPLLLSQVSLGACAKGGCGGICVSVLFTSWLRRQQLEQPCNVCTLLSSLYSNDRPCCFTCRGGRSVALSLQPSL